MSVGGGGGASGSPPGPRQGSAVFFSLRIDSDRLRRSSVLTNGRRQRAAPCRRPDSKRCPAAAQQRRVELICFIATATGGPLPVCFFSFSFWACARLRLQT